MFHYFTLEIGQLKSQNAELASMGMLHFLIFSVIKLNGLHFNDTETAWSLSPFEHDRTIFFL